MLKVDIRYTTLLKQFCGNEELYELLKLVRDDSLREKENYYLKHKQYPSERDLLAKLVIDLDTTKEFIQVQNEQKRK